MNFNEWNKLRGKLNHDWLQNRFLTFLKARMSCMSGQDICYEEWEEITEQLSQWQQKKDSFVTLIRNAEQALSPLQLFEHPPLCEMTNENKEWLGNLVHNLFVTRTSIRNRIESLDLMLSEIDKTVEMTMKTFKIGQSYSTIGDNLIQSVMKFSRAISELPRSIEVL